MNYDEILARESGIIGKRIVQLRSRLGISREELAKLCRFSFNTIAKLENGTGNFTQLQRFHICNFFGVPYDLFDPGKDFSTPDFQQLKEQAEAYVLSNHPKSIKKFREKLSANNALSILRERVLPSGFLDEPREVKEIRLLLQENYDSTPSGSTISNALRKLIEEKRVKQVPSSKKRVFLYVSTAPAAQN